MSTEPIAIPKGSSSSHPASPSPATMAEHIHPPLKLHTRRGSRSAPDPWALGPLSSSADTHSGMASPVPQSAGGLSSSMAAAAASGAISIPSSSASRITIVRVHDDNGGSALADGDAPLDGSPSSYGSSRPGRSNSWGSLHSASGSSTNVNTRSNSPGAARRPGGRMTFAFSSFTPINPPTPSPSTERGRPSFSSGASAPGTPGNVSPTHTYSPSHQGGQGSQHNVAGGHQRRRTHSNPGGQHIKPSLTAQQIYELAISSTSPTGASVGMHNTASAELAAFAPGSAGAAIVPPSPSSSPIHTSSPLAHGHHHHNHHHQRTHSHSRSRPTTPGLLGEKTSPAVFRPLPDEVYLPFINRPAEVSALLTEQPTSRLFHLLEALFPSASNPGTPAREFQAPLPSAGAAEDDDDPTTWSFPRLSHHLVNTTRAEMDDKAWVDAARACIRGRSEALWERFKGALGVPAELELEHEHEHEGEEYEFEEPMAEMPIGLGEGIISGAMSGYAESEGKSVAGGGAPSDVNAPLGLSSSVGDLASLGYIASPLAVSSLEREAVIEPVWADQSDSEDEEQKVRERMVEQEEAAAAADEGMAGHRFSALNRSSGALSEGGWSSGRMMENIGEGSDEERDGDEDDEEEDQRSIREDEPKYEDYGTGVLSPTREIRALQITTAPSLFSPATIVSSLGTAGSPALGATRSSSSVHIPQHQQGQTEDSSTTVAPTPVAATGESILGMETNTSTPSAMTPVHSVSNTPPPALFAPPPSITTTIATPPIVPPSSSPPSTSNAPRVMLRRPSESISQTLSSGASTPNGTAPTSSLPASGYRGFGGYGLAPANRPYHPALSERGPGNPLFPSSFAGLSVGPTLAANVPKTSRSASIASGTPYPSSLRAGGTNSTSNVARSDASGSPSSLRRFVSLGHAGHSGPSGAGGRSGAMKGTWADVRDRYEYAITVASASSDGGRG